MVTNIMTILEISLSISVSLEAHEKIVKNVGIGTEMQ